MNDAEDTPTYLLYPPFIEQSYPNRTLAYFDLDLHRLVLETGQEIDCTCWQDVKDAMFNLNLLTFIDTLTTFPWLDAIIESCNPKSKRGTVVFSTEQGEIINARIRNSRYTRWLITAFSWGLTQCSIAVLHTLRDVFTHTGVGTQTTPGAIGQALMRKSWADQYGHNWHGQRHLRPPGAAISLLRLQSTGSRSELIEGLSAGYHPVVIELDRKNAYAAAFVEQPTGHTLRFVRGLVKGLKKYFAKCTVTITTPLLLGPFPQRIEIDGASEICYPTSPGTYNVTLWNDEIQLCQEEGCTVEIHDGYGWRETTRDPELWVKTMEVLRDTAPSEDVASYVKLATVAGIGRHGMPEASYQVGLEESDINISFSGKSYEWYVHKIWDDHPTGMQHWFNHTLMICRLALFHEAKKWHSKELLYGTNVDAVYISPDANVENYVDKDVLVPSGTWRKSIWHGEPGKDTFPATRHLVTQEKVRRPGVPKDMR